ncbi:hypothetical protein L226DRAFT_526109 [Lentinus tigrinus ALCF2SS1-7]|uniref:uncharacterized protein n=1 Tax=Lentinus tigrinus ALCF2SS1-7 TaxID=1328758 RepID=UPI0011660D5C|nr:hypothetical protein L226DRAFT_526109 [Lentinus tigrinus ALCF2SS1-7]
MKNAEQLCEQVVESITDELEDIDPEKLVARIAVLAQLALRAPDAFEQKSDDEMMETDTDWLEDAAIPLELKAKILALKVCRNRCLAHVESETALDIAQPVIQMFLTVLQYEGSFSADDADSPWARARLRLQATTSLLHLSTVKKYALEVSKYFVPIAITIQDPVYQVRMTFLDKLISFLSQRRIHPMYNIVPFLSVHDPELDAQAYVKFALRALPKALTLETFEHNFIRLLHLLAHHPDFAIDVNSIPDMAGYIQFFLELDGTSDNIALLFHIAQKAKTVRDAESHVYSENLYAAYAKAKSWNLDTWPGKVRLPPDILRPLPSAEATNKILKTVYLSEEALSWLAEKSKQPNEEKEKKPRAPRQPTAKRKAAGPKTNGTSKRARTGQKRKQDDTDEDEEPSDSEMDEDDKENERAMSSPAKPEESESSSEEEADGEKKDKPATRVVESDEIPADALELAKEKRSELIEQLAEVDDEVGELLIMDEDPTTPQLAEAIRRATISLKFSPVFLGSTINNTVVQPLLDSVCAYLPTPAESKVTAHDTSFPVSSPRFPAAAPIIQYREWERTCTDYA